MARKPLDALRLAEVLTSGSLFANGAAPSSPKPDPGENADRENDKTGSTKPVPVTTPDSRSSANPPTPQKPASTTRPTAPTNKPVAPTLDHSVLIVGHKVIGPDRYGEAVGPPLDALAKHTVVLAGAGSGKTVLLYRLVEEAALRGIPSIVVDCANDLSSFDEPKDSSPHWHPGDDALARLSFPCIDRDDPMDSRERKSGNPLTLQPLARLRCRERRCRGTSGRPAHGPRVALGHRRERGDRQSRRRS